MITEFVAVNGGELTDAQGETSDWIEIYNDGLEADALSFLGRLFRDDESLPCDSLSVADGSNGALFDIDDDGRVSIGDVLHLLRFLFDEGAPGRLGRECVLIADCPEVCP